MSLQFSSTELDVLKTLNLNCTFPYVESYIDHPHQQDPSKLFDFKKNLAFAFLDQKE